MMLFFLAYLHHLQLFIISLSLFQILGINIVVTVLRWGSYNFYNCLEVLHWPKAWEAGHSSGEKRHPKAPALCDASPGQDAPERGCGAASGQVPEMPSPQTEPEPHRPAGEAPGRDGLLPFTGVFWSLRAPRRLPAARFSPCQAAFWSLLGRPGTGPGGRLLITWGSSWGSLHRRVAALMQPGLARVGLAWALGRGSPARRDFTGGSLGGVQPP